MDTYQLQRLMIEMCPDVKEHISINIEHYTKSITSYIFMPKNIYDHHFSNFLPWLSLRSLYPIRVYEDSAAEKAKWVWPAQPARVRIFVE